MNDKAEPKEINKGANLRFFVVSVFLFNNSFVSLLTTLDLITIFSTVLNCDLYNLKRMIEAIISNKNKGIILKLVYKGPHNFKKA